MRHIAFIMDGNRTWAKNHGLMAFQGHKKGYENAKKIILHTSKREVPFITFWVLSDDNIKKRSHEEVRYLFTLLENGILDIAADAVKNNMRIRCIGNLEMLSDGCRRSIKIAEDRTKSATGVTIILAIGYGGQEEIAEAVRKLAVSGVDMSSVTSEMIKGALQSAEFPPPDLIVRTGGHIRHSGFLLFLCPYSEYFFSKKNWPEFSEADVDEAIQEFTIRQRKFGK